MSDGSVRTSQFPTKNSISAADTVVVNVTAANGTTNTCQVSVQALLANTSNLTSIGIGTGTAPANSTANGVAGTVVQDGTYLYVCVATNTWRRFTGSAF